jgi:FkbH-like protein
MTKELVQSVVSLLKSVSIVPTAKVIAVDCDNTLWGGVIGEDGIDKIGLGEDFPGRVYRKFQFDLLNLKNCGFILCLLSKNNLSDVKNVFENHDGMVLRWEDFAAFRINWSRKSQNLAEIAQELNLGIDSFIFIDDSSVEIAEMQEILPSVQCIQVPEELEDFPAIFQNFNLLNPISVTVEDLKRSNMISVEKQRASMMAEANLEDFLNQLNLELTLSILKPHDLERVSQLVNKTNQFNFTTKRFSVSEISSFLDSSNKVAVTGRLKDRFGEYGLVGVIFLEDVNTKNLRVSNCLVSCRALGRGMELPFFIKSIDKFVRPNQIVSVEKVESNKNSPAMQFLEQFHSEWGDPVHDWKDQFALRNSSMSYLSLRWLD